MDLHFMKIKKVQEHRTERKREKKVIEKDKKRKRKSKKQKNRVVRKVWGKKSKVTLDK